MFMEIHDEQSTLVEWERTFVLEPKKNSDIYFHCRIFKNASIDVPHFRIDEVHVFNMLRIEIGGGWKSWEEIPDVTPNSTLYWHNIEPLFENILGRIQDEYPGFRFEFSYDDGSEGREILDKIEVSDEENEENVFWF